MDTSKLGNLIAANVAISLGKRILEGEEIEKCARGVDAELKPMVSALSRAREWMVQPMGGGLLHERFDDKDTCETNCLLCAINNALIKAGSNNNGR